LRGLPGSRLQGQRPAQIIDLASVVRDIKDRTPCLAVFLGCRLLVHLCPSLTFFVHGLSPTRKLPRAAGRRVALRIFWTLTGPNVDLRFEMLHPLTLPGINSVQKGFNLHFGEGLAIRVEFAQ
jgi:hypothetical protein